VRLLYVCDKIKMQLSAMCNATHLRQKANDEMNIPIWQNPSTAT
jgi:hypothetical protein